MVQFAYNNFIKLNTVGVPCHLHDSYLAIQVIFALWGKPVFPNSFDSNLVKIREEGSRRGVGRPGKRGNNMETRLQPPSSSHYAQLCRLLQKSQRLSCLWQDTDQSSLPAMPFLAGSWKCVSLLSRLLKNLWWLLLVGMLEWRLGFGCFSVNFWFFRQSRAAIFNSPEEKMETINTIWLITRNTNTQETRGRLEVEISLSLLELDKLFL